MFIYTFKSKGNYLVNHVVITGKHLTLYTTQNSCGAIQPLINKLKLSDNTMSGDHPAHSFLHNPFVSFSKKGDSVPHKHLKFKDTNNLENLKSIFIFLLARQNSNELRKKDYDDFLAAINQERKDRGDKEFPSYVKKALNEYDLTTPFFPADELETLLFEYKKHLGSNSFIRYAEQIAEYAEEILDKNWETIYSKQIFCAKDKLSDEEKQLINFYNCLTELRIALLGIHYENSVNWYELAINTINHINNNSYFKKIKSIQDMLNIFSKKIPEISAAIDLNIQKTKQKYLLILVVGLSILDYFRVDSNKKYLIDVTSIGLSCIIANYAYKPIMKASQYVYQFFKQGSVPAEEKSSSSSSGVVKSPKHISYN